MTVQAERPAQATTSAPSKRRKAPVGAVLAGLAIVAASVVAAVAVGHHSRHAQPNPVLGHSLQPLPVYRVELPSSASPGRTTRVVPDLGRPGHATRIDKTPTFTLHVQYAHVRQVAGRWQLILTAPEGRTFNVDTTQGQFYDVLIHGRAVSLFFVAGTQGPGPDHGTNFAFGPGPNSMTRSDAVATAHNLTSSVFVD